MNVINQQNQHQIKKSFIKFPTISQSTSQFWLNKFLLTVVNSSAAKCALCSLVDTIKKTFLKINNKLNFNIVQITLFTPTDLDRKQ